MYCATGFIAYKVSHLSYYCRVWTLSLKNESLMRPGLNLIIYTHSAFNHSFFVALLTPIARVVYARATGFLA